MKIIDFWETKENKYNCSLEELEKKLHFSYLPTIAFTDQELKKHLYKKGSKAFEQGLVNQKYLFEARSWKHSILEGFIVPSSIRFIDTIVGYGLFAEVDLPKDVFIGEYAGIVRENNNHAWISNYLYSYPLLDEIGRNYVIDAHWGSLTRFINHSYTPNLYTTYAFFEGFFHMILLTLYPIKKGTQLTFNYGKNYWYVRSEPKELK